MDINNNQFNHILNMNNIESGYNVLLDNGIILSPPINSLRRDQFFINLHDKIMHKINNKSQLNENDIKLCQNTGGGNCFYKVISQFYHNNERYHAYYRKKLAEDINTIKNVEARKHPYIYKNNNEVLNFIDYFNQMIITGNFAGEYEIRKLSEILHCNIIIYTNFNFAEKDMSFNFEFETIISPNNQINPFYPIILMGWVNNIHYILIFPIDYPDNLICDLIINEEENIIQNYTDNKKPIVPFNNKLNIYNNNNKINNNKQIQKSLEKKSADKKESIPEKNKKKNVRSNNDMLKYKEFLSTYVKNNKSIYPAINGTKSGETKLEDIYKYLLSEKNSEKGEREWPDYIKKAIEHNKNIKNKKIKPIKLDKETLMARKKKGRSNKAIIYEKNEIINIKNRKNQFRRTAKKFILSEDNKLLYKNKTKKLNKETNTYEYIIENFKVPTIKELNQFLYEYHTKNFHCNYKELINIFYKNKIGFFGITKIIEDYVSNCPICVQTMRTVHRNEPVHAICVNGPNVRYEFDLTFLNDDLANSYDVKILLGIIDVFSRKAMIYKEKDKKADNILKDIIEFCVNNNFPQEFVSDNGPEFKNSKINEFCINNGIRYIHGIPYNPHTQGTIERFHYTIKKYLGKEYVQNGYKKLNFDSVRIRLINYYNNKKHRMIGMSPNEASKITNEEEIKLVNERKEKEFEKINKKRTYLEEDDCCLLNPKFVVIGNNTLIFNYIKKGKYKVKIPVKILNKASYGYYKIKLYADFKNKKISLKKKTSL